MALQSTPVLLLCQKLELHRGNKYLFLPPKNILVEVLNPKNQLGKWQCVQVDVYILMYCAQARLA
jgi:hypothetical protein